MLFFQNFVMDFHYHGIQLRANVPSVMIKWLKNNVEMFNAQHVYLLPIYKISFGRKMSPII